LFIDEEVLIIGVVDLDIGLVAHIDLRILPGKVETYQKRIAFNTWHRCANKYDDMVSLGCSK
jgi:hypothetical protein